MPTAETGKRKENPEHPEGRSRKPKPEYFHFWDKASTTQFVRSLTPNIDIKPRTSADLLTVDLATYFGDSK